jgi:ketosteroid isomerase-like protein
MSLELNKQIASRLIESIGNGRVDDNPFADDFAVWTSSSGNVAGAEWRRRCKRIKEITKSGVLPLNVIGLTAEGERVAVQAAADAELTDGSQYHNDYHFLVVIRGGKICNVFEYMNTKAALDQALPLIRALPPQ